jgi:hypothetical protein
MEQMIFCKKNGFFTLKNPRSGRPSKPISNGIADDCHGRKEQEKKKDIQVPFCREQAGGDQEGVAGKKKTDQQTGFRKNDNRQYRIPAPGNQALDVLQLRDDFHEEMHIERRIAEMRSRVTGRTKFQIPSTKCQISSKYQIFKYAFMDRLIICSFVIYLEFGAWNLEF